jgi:hypothetical protein
MMFYIATGCARIRTEAYETCQIRNQTGDVEKDWEAVLRRSTLIEDDGHASKLVRSLALGRQVSQSYEETTENGKFELKGEEWLKIANMGILFLFPDWKC